jgi:hypothetical protein
MMIGQAQPRFGCEDMQNFKTGDDRRAQRQLRGSALSSMALSMFGAQKMSGQVASGAYKCNLRFEYGERHTCLSGPGSVSGFMKWLEMVGRLIKRFLPLVAWGALMLAPIRLQATSLTTTQTLQAVISPLGGLFSFPNSVTLTKTGTTFSSFTGSLTIQYDARTTQSTGGGSITVKATTDFTPARGPSIASPPSTGDALQYTCAGATLGTGCSGTQTVSTTASTNVITLSASECTGGGGSCSSASPNTVTLNFTLTDDPEYKVSTGSYSATLTFTISAS